MKIALFTPFFALSIAQAAITFNLTFIDAVGESWTAARQGVLAQAANEWGNLFLDDYTIDVDVTFTTGESYLGQWSGSLSYPLGADVTPWAYSSHTISFNADLLSGDNYLWFDPTPLTSDDQPFEAWDALSVARHEFGHLLGFTNAGFYESNKGTGGAIDHWGDQLSGGTPYIFDAAGLNVEMNGSDSAHIADTGVYAGDLMVPAIANSLRRDISSLDIAMLSMAYGYTMVPEPAVFSFLLGGLGISFFALWRRRS